MTTVNEALNYIAEELKKKQPESFFYWDIRAEIPNEEIVENKNLIAILHLKSQEEIIHKNRTMRLYADITGQILVKEYSNDIVRNEVKLFEEYIQNFTSSLGYTEILNVIIIEANSGLIETGSDSIYLTFNLPLEFVIQF